METVFGLNQFTIKKFNPDELGLVQYHNSDYTIELRQHYFYLFWIPFFALGKKWVIRKNNQVFDAPAVLRDELNTRHDLSVQTPWYTYAGVFVTALMALGFFIYSKFESFAWQKQLAEQYAFNYSANLSKYNEPSLNDYYVMVAADGYSRRFARVSAFNRDHIQLSFITDAHVWAGTPGSIAALFKQHAGHLKKISIDRNKPAAILCKNYEEVASFNGISIGDKEATTWRLEHILRIDGPVLTSGSFESIGRNGSINIEIKNEGLNTTITGIETVKGEIHWSQNQLPVPLHADGTFVLNGQGNVNIPYIVMIYCTDSRGKTVRWMMEGFGSACETFYRVP